MTEWRQTGINILEVLERRAKLIAAERKVSRRPMNSDGFSTLKHDAITERYSDALNSKKTKAERAGENARLQALSEAIGLITGERTEVVWHRIQNEAHIRSGFDDEKA